MDETDMSVADQESFTAMRVMAARREARIGAGRMARRGEQPTGVCIDCDLPIPEERLRAQPGAVRCIDCQEGHERTDGGWEDE